MHLILAMRLRLPRLKKFMLHNTQTAQMLTLLSLLRVHLKNRVKPVWILSTKNLAINKSIVSQVVESGFDGVFLVAANPVDILTYSTWKFSGFPKERVIWPGTSLDTARFRQALAEKIGIDARSVHAYIMGDHGDSKFAVWSHPNVAGEKLEQWLQENRDIDEEGLVRLFESVRDAAYCIINKKVLHFMVLQWHSLGLRKLY